MSDEHLSEIPLEVTYSSPRPITDHDYEKVYLDRYAQLGRLVYIHTYVKNLYQHYLNIINIINLVLSSLITILTVLTFNFNCNISLGMNIAITVCSVTITILGGIANIYDLSSQITRYQQYIDKVNSIFGEMLADLNIPDDVEGPAGRKKFLMTSKNRYIHVIQHAPEIPTWIYVLAHKAHIQNQKEFKDQIIV